MNTACNTNALVDVAPAMLHDWIEQGTCVVVDVREDFEHAAERIPGAQHHPLSQFDPAALRTAHGEKRLVFHCRSGKRSTEAALRFQDGDKPAFHLAGGINAWKTAGFATQRSAAAPRIDIMRQVQIVAGSLVLIGVLLGAFISPWFLLLSGFVGSGLVFAGLSGWCGMALLLARMPWNKAASSCVCAS